MTDTEEVINYCMVRIIFVGVPYGICGLVNVMQEAVRCLGHSNLSLGISIVANIAFRLAWIWTVYPALYVEGSIRNNYAYICMVWPASWVISLALATVAYFYLIKKLEIKFKNENTVNEKETVNVTT